MHIIQKYFHDIEVCVHEFNINIESLQSNDSDDFLYTKAIVGYKKLFLNLLLCNAKEDIHERTKELVNFAIEYDISYLFLYSELVTVVRKLLSSLVQKHDFENIEEIDRYFAEHEYQITVLYLEKFLNGFIFKCELRLSHIELIPDKKFMVHYASHLQWIINLILYIQKQEFDDNYPEINPNQCEFGQWMKSATASYLLTTSHFKQIDRLHINLHDLAANVINYCKHKVFRPQHLFILCKKLTIIHLKSEMKLPF
jgi:hypothetical protein